MPGRKRKRKQNREMKAYSRQRKENLHKAKKRKYARQGKNAQAK